MSVVGTAIAATTDDSGRFRLEDVPGGRAELHFEGRGIDAHLEVEGLQPGQTLAVTVRLSGASAAIVEPGDDNGAAKGGDDGNGEHGRR